MEYISVEDLNELRAHSSAIRELFRASFGTRLDERVWEWAYLENPNGSPVVSLAYHDGMLVGHYAVIPFPLKNNNGEHRRAFLSMTTMVHPNFRKFGLFVELAEMTYGVLRRQEADLVCGFPNSMSAPGFRKKLNWKFGAQNFLVRTTRSTIVENIAEVPSLIDSADSFYLDVGDDRTKTWRFSKPGFSYVVKDGLVTKKFGSDVDIVLLDDRDQVFGVPEADGINLLVPDSASILKRLSRDAYLFGFLALTDRSTNDEFVQQMFMSDVF